MPKIKIFHTNDIHSNFDNLAKITTYLKENRTQNDLLLDAGDFHDFKNIMITGTNGKGGKDLLNYLKYDAICVGNNEGFSGIKCLEEMSVDEVPLISVNLTTTDNKQIGNVKKSIIIEKAGVRFLIIGVTPYYGKELTPTYNVFFNLDGMHSNEPIERIKQEIAVNKGRYDICILLSHSALLIDKYFSKKIPEIDIIVGGHCHTAIAKAEKSNNAIIVEAGEYGKYLGILEVDIKNNKIIDYKNKLIPNDFDNDLEFEEKLEQLNNIAVSNLNKTLMIIDKLNYHQTQENDLINFICDSLLLEHKCDFAFINNGIVENELTNNISKMKLLECSPSPLNPTSYKLLGKNFKEAIIQSFDNEFCLQNGRGAGFRGKVLGAIGVSNNVEITKNPLTIKVNGKILDEEAYYNIVTSDYLQRGTYYTSLKVENEDATFHSGYIRDLIERNISNKNLVELAKTRRIKK